MLQLIIDHSDNPIGIAAYSIMAALPPSIEYLNLSCMTISINYSYFSNFSLLHSPFLTSPLLYGPHTPLSHILFSSPLLFSRLSILLLPLYSFSSIQGAGYRKDFLSTFQQFQQFQNVQTSKYLIFHVCALYKQIT